MSSEQQEVKSQQPKENVEKSQQESKPVVEKKILCIKI
jgi:hypothetical protein